MKKEKEKKASDEVHHVQDSLRRVGLFCGEVDPSRITRAQYRRFKAIMDRLERLPEPEQIESLKETQ